MRGTARFSFGFLIQTLWIRAFSCVIVHATRKSVVFRARTVLRDQAASMMDIWYREAHADHFHARDRGRVSNLLRAIQEAQAALAQAVARKARLVEAIAARGEALEWPTPPRDEETWHAEIAVLEDAIIKADSDIASARRADASARRAAIEARQRGQVLRWS